MATMSQRLLGPYVASPGDVSAVASGSKMLLGDNVFMTAAHMAFEYNHQKDSNPAAITVSDIIIRNGSSEAFRILLDYRGYQAKYAAQVKSEYLATATNRPSNQTI